VEGRKKRRKEEEEVDSLFYISQGYVGKDNRRLVAAVCLLLAIKFEEVLSRQAVKNVVDVMVKKLDVVANEVFGKEIPIYKELSFCLFVDLSEVLPHFTRLQETLEVIIFFYLSLLSSLISFPLTHSPCSLRS
jgi:hypothetical protein